MFGFERTWATGGWRSRVGYTRFRGLTAFGKVAVVLAILLAGAGITEAARAVLVRRDPESLRAEVQRRLEAQDYVGARRALDALAATSPDGLSDADRWELGDRVQAELGRLGRDLRAEALEHWRAGRTDAALASLRALTRLGIDADWSAYTQAEVLRSAGRLAQAAAAYLACADAYPTSALADDALYWAGMVRLATRQVDEARQIWRRLVRSYPSSAWRADAERDLERTAPRAELRPTD